MVREEIVFGDDECLCGASKGGYTTSADRRHASVNRTDTQMIKVWTIQMMMTLILTPSLRIKTNTD
jgi:hypothetical protein